MDSLITAGRAPSRPVPLGALNRVALREDAPALALRGIAKAQLGDLVRAKALLKSAASAFGPKEAVAREVRRRGGRDRARLARTSACLQRRSMHRRRPSKRFLSTFSLGELKLILRFALGAVERGHHGQIFAPVHPALLKANGDGLRLRM